MEFIMEYQVWFITGGVILFMAFIGYIAEKTDFGRKEFAKKVVEEPKKQKELVEVKKEEVKENIVSAEQTSALEVEPGVVSNEEIIATEFTETSSMDNWGGDIPTAINVAVEEDLTVPLQETSAFEVQEEQMAPELVIEEDLTVPLQETVAFEIQEEQSMPTFVENEITNEEVENTETQIKEEASLELPVIETVVEEQEDDIWKF